MQTSTLFKAAATVSGFALMAASGAILAKSFTSSTEIKEYLWGLVLDALDSSSTHMTMVITELQPNKVFEDAQVYLSTRISSSSTKAIRVFKHDKNINLTSALVQDEVFTVTFEGVKLCWILRCRQIDNTQVRYYDLSFPKKAKEMVTGTYLPFVSHVAASTRKRVNTLRLFSLDQTDNWRPVTFNHPSTFHTMALDPQVKRSLTDDLDQFREGVTFCNNVGKAWYKCYLLYGPTGTGKSSLIAAMANYLKADVYDLDLTQVSNTSQLRRLLMGTANRSILCVEDIDCFKNIEVTLSSLLDFMDRGWSNCGHQRIIVFTARDKEKLDSALLTPTRVDIQIHMSYCTPSAFEFFASNYLNISSHKLFEEIMELILEVEASPAEVAEQLLRHSSVDKALEGLVELLTAKKVDKEKPHA